MREDIVGMLKNAIERGGNPARIAQSLVNSGYPMSDVQEALAFVASNISSEQNAQNTANKNQPNIQKQNNSGPQIRATSPPKLSPLKPLPASKPRKLGRGRLILMFSILAVLTIALVCTIMFKDKILDLLG